MSVTCTLFNQTVNFDRDVFSASATYHIFDNGNAQLTCQDILGSASVSALVGDGGTALASFGAYLAGSGTGTSAYRKLRYTGYALRNDEGQYHWTMTINFDSQASDSAPSASAYDTVPENAPGFTAVEMNIENTIVPAYRTVATAPSTDALRDVPNESDVGGTSVDQAGDPIDVMVTQVKFTVRNVIRGRLSGTIFGNIADQTGTRNDTALTIAGFSCPVGKLLFTGAQVTRVGPNAYEVCYGLTYDHDYHLRQIAKVDANGKPLLGVLSSGSISTVPATMDAADAAASQGVAPRYAAHVMWKQPFKSRTDFSNLFPAGFLTSIA